MNECRVKNALGKISQKKLNSVYRCPRWVYCSRLERKEKEKRRKDEKTNSGNGDRQQCTQKIAVNPWEGPLLVLSLVAFLIYGDV